VSTTRVSFFPKYSVVNKQEKRCSSKQGMKEKNLEQLEEENGRKSRLSVADDGLVAAVNPSLAYRGGPSRPSGGDTARSTSSSFFYQVRRPRRDGWDIWKHSHQIS
jgi:predicted heme/steroid binding protein